jgi:hypothetical protein
MNKLVKTMVLLVTVIGSTATYASVDSTSLTSKCNITAIEDTQKYRVSFEAPSKENVKVLLYNEQDQLIFSEVVRDTEGFQRVYDISDIAVGTYSLKVRSNSFSYEESLVKEGWKGEGLIISRAMDGKVAVLGDVDEDFSLSILDEDGELLYTDGYGKDEIIQKLFNLENIKGSTASFIISIGNKVIREAIVKL